MKPLIEVKGIAFPNKGAEMLLVACLEQFAQRNLYAALEPYSPFEHKLRYPVFTKLRAQRFGMNLLAPFTVLPAFARERLGFVRGRDLSMILDASGFAYGAPWPASLARERLLGEGLRCPFVMLPQSYGEFSEAGHRSVARQISDRAARVFAREAEGAAHFFDATGQRPPVVPDITFGVRSPASPHSPDVVIVPNFQVEKREGAAYVIRSSALPKHDRGGAVGALLITRRHEDLTSVTAFGNGCPSLGTRPTC